MTARFSLPSALASPSPPIRGVLWMIAASLLYASSYVSVRELSDTISHYELVLFRMLFGLVFVLPLLMRIGISGLRTTRLRDYWVRAVLVYVGMVCWVYALANLPLAEAMSLIFTVPLFTVPMAALWLKERVGPHRTMAIVAGFCGALVIIRPGFAGLSLPALAVLFTAMIYGGCNVLTRSLTTTEHPDAVVFYMFALVVPLAAVPAAVTWITPTWADGPWIIALGATTAVAQMCFTRSLAAAPMGVVMPFFFLQLPVGASLGFLLYGEAPDRWVWIGAAIICVSGYAIARREAGRSG